MWRSYAFDFPAACAATVDIVTAESLRNYLAYYGGVARCQNPMQFAAEQSKFAEAAFATLLTQGRQLEKDLELAFKGAC
jgi:hypothetical protein